MSLFNDIVTIPLIVEFHKYGNNISFFIVDKQGAISKYSDIGYSFKIDENEKYFFAFDNRRITINFHH